MEQEDFLVEKCENRFFDIRKGPGNSLSFLGYPGDPSGMNWIEGRKNWGETVAPEGILTEVSRGFTADGNLQEIYTFTNSTEFPVFFQKTDIGIYTTFNVNYVEAAVCL